MSLESSHERDRNLHWLLADKKAIGAQIEQGFAQAERGELIDAEDAVQLLQARQTNRRA